MKPIIILVVLSFVITCAYSQEGLIVGLKTKTGEGLSSLSEVKPVSSVKKFVFKVYGDNGNPRGEVEPHFMGNDIAIKWTLVNEMYLRKTDVSIGFGSSYTETLKPSILNAVYRMNTHYKKALSRKAISEENAKKQFSWILDCAIAIFYCGDSSEFELALTKTKDPVQIDNLFNAVILEKN